MIHPVMIAAAQRGLLATALLAGLGGPAGAMAVDGPGGTAEQGRRLVVAAPTNGAVAATLDLVSARLDGVDATAGTLNLRGQAVPVHTERLRVQGPRGQDLGGLRALRAGMQVRFALEPLAANTGAGLSPAAAASAAAGAPARRVVLVQVEAP